MKKYLIGMAFCLVAGGASAQTFTDAVEVRTVETLTNSEQTFIRSANGGWGLAGCETAEFVNLSAANGPSYNAQVAIALTAQASGAVISAFGTCSPNGTVVIAQRLRLG